ncbi:alpha-amylase [Spirochaeta africana]|uniref:Glycosidase n=1 Tax=Spirochaeta africana (strain ATCC 700263 / DSM 8902 / Z-7692) TaxID=889378 RepID=H9ULB2_SPIAZ|nr:alpha-amylase [Spirochaeta africana]AFG38305.1 glycosidase [Spirochaeta africana DSM 8902]
MSNRRGVILQFFHWYNKDDGKLWNKLSDEAESLSKAGFSSVWLPPAYKGHVGASDTGYGVYDLYDLGEFDQKGSVRTKYGTKDEYLRAIKTLQKFGMQSYADIVLNHRMGADATEIVNATPYSKENRQQPKGDLHEIEAHTHFSFPARKGKYSNFEWHWWHFDAVDFNQRSPDDSSTIYVFEGKTFDDYVSGEYGNYDYLMGCDLDFQNDEVREELIKWGKWYLDVTGVDGFRLDAIKHIPSWFFPIWLNEIRKHAGKELPVAGEYWDPDIGNLITYLEQTESSLMLFDVPLHYNFHSASIGGNGYDLRNIYKNTLMKERPSSAVTFVSNHDSQALQALESVVEPWFKPLAYALILLRREGYPCVFYADYYGAEYTDHGNDGDTHEISMPSHKWLIDKFLHARKNFTFGEQIDYFDHSNVIGWTFSGDNEHPGAMAVLMSNGSEGKKAMNTGKARETFIDITEHIKEKVETDENGWGEFVCPAGSLSVWISIKA